MNRPDISNYLAHFTSSRYPKGYKDATNPTNRFMRYSAEKRLINMLQERTIYASQLPWVGNQKAVCLTECPWTSLVGHTVQYSSFGIGFSKSFIFSKGGGPAFYVRADRFNNQHWDQGLLPFVTPFWPDYRPKELEPDIRIKKCDYTHEREWRIANENLLFDYSDIAFVVLPDYEAMARFPKELKDSIGREKFLLMENYKK